QVVFDRATGLRWQQGGSDEYMTLVQAQEYVAEMNSKKLGGYANWRLPTVEEAMSLMEPRKSGDLYIDKIFDRRQRWIWTSDKYAPGAAWVVSFYGGSCYHLGVGYDLYVRLVR
ncbi:DUF1566 domain-containing protein, partial [candidate division KSB1 bacterium]|nr:DUF1566 domain-containing protein [candidate division KSB1 bacterium]